MAKLKETVMFKLKDFTVIRKYNKLLFMEIASEISTIRVRVYKFKLPNLFTIAY